MGKVCLIMQHITICTSCITFMLVSHTCILVIGHAEQGPEETPESAQVEGINSGALILSKTKVNPDASNHHYLSLFYPFIS
jgi:hypothetical protein